MFRITKIQKIAAFALAAVSSAAFAAGAAHLTQRTRAEDGAVTVTAETDSHAFGDDPCMMTDGSEFLSAQAASVSFSGESENFPLLEDAVAFAAQHEGSILTLMQDAQLEEALLVESGRFTIDLDGRTLSAGGQTGVLRLTGTANIALKDSGDTGKITGGGGDEGCGVYIGAGCTFTMNGGEISGNSAKNGGGVCLDGGTFTMENGTVTGNRAENGGGVYVSSGEFTFRNGEISSNNASQDGGGIFSECGFTLGVGAVSRNTAVGAGGGIFLSEGTLNVTGRASIVGNEAQTGAGISLSGAGILSMSGGEITGNSAQESGGGVYVPAGATVRLGGSAAIGYNYATGASNLFLAAAGEEQGAIEIISRLTGENGGIGVGFGEGYRGAFTRSPDPAWNDPAKFSLDSPAPGEEILFDAAGQLLTGTAAVVVGQRKMASAEDAVAYAKQHAGSAVALFKENELEDTLTLDGGAFTFDLNGFSLKGNGQDYVLRIAAGAEITLKDGGTGGSVTSGGASAGGILVEGSLIMTGGTVTGNASAEDGGIRIAADGSLSMSGGTVSGNGAGIVAEGRICLSGSAKVTDNGTGARRANVLLSNGVTIEVGELSEDASIGVTVLGGDAVFTSGYSLSLVKYFRSDDEEGKCIWIDRAFGGSTGELRTGDHRFLAEEQYFVRNERLLAPTCTAAGHGDLDCANPDCIRTKYEENLPALGHDWEWTAAGNILSVTCKHDGGHGGVVALMPPTELVYSGETFQASVVSSGLAQFFADYGIDAPTDGDVVYEKQVGGEWTSVERTEVVNAGEYRAVLRLSGARGEERLSVELQVVFTVEKAEIDMAGVTWDYEGPFTYSGSLFKVELSNLPDGVSANYTENEETGAGSYTAHAAFEFDRENYRDIPEMTLAWEIEKADYDMSEVKWSYTSPFVYNRGAYQVVLTKLPEGVTANYTENEATNAGTYNARATFDSDTANYNPIEEMTLVWEISRRQVTAVKVTVLSKVYDGTTAVTGVRYTTPTLTGTCAGDRVFLDVDTERSFYESPDAGKGINVTLYLGLGGDDRDNYQLTEQVRMTTGDISRKQLIVEIGFEGTLVYGQEWTATGKFSTFGKPIEGDEVEILLDYGEGGKPTRAGDYAVTATLSGKDSANYILAQTTKSFTIEKAEIDMAGVEWDYEEPFTYNGSPFRVELTNLPEGVTANYTENEEITAGSYTAHATFEFDRENYRDIPEMTLSWEILKADYDMSEVEWDYEGPFTYSGSPFRVELLNLPEGVTANYTENEEITAGSYTAHATFTADTVNHNPIEEMTLSWEILKADYDMSEVEWDYEGPFTYSGSPFRVELLNLPDGVTANYTENEETAAGSYTAHATFTADTVNHNPIPEMTLEWEILRAAYDLSGVKWNYLGPFTYNGTLFRVELTGLPEGVTASYTENEATDAGTYTARAILSEDSQNYNPLGERTLTWEIKKADYDMSQAKWNYVEPFIYNGSRFVLQVTGLPEKVRAVYTGNVQKDAGVYTATANFSGDEQNYNPIPEMTLEWQILKADYDMSGVEWNYTEPFTYNGTAFRVELTNLPEGVSASYTENEATNAGSYTAHATFTADTINHNPIEEKTLEWEIKKADFNMSGVKWNYEEPFTYSGSPFKVELTNLPEGVTASYTENEATNAGSYTAHATFTADTINHNPIEEKTLEWEIKKADFDMSGVEWNYTEPFTYNGTAFRVELTNLPEGVTASYTENEATNAGSHTARATFTADTINHNPIEEKTLEWEIKKADFDMSGVEWNYTEPFTYNGTAFRVELTNLPEGVTASYTENEATNAGSHTARATFTADTVNHNPIEEKTLVWLIRKADFDMSEVVWNYNESLTYNGMAFRVMLVNLPRGVTANYTENEATNAGTYTAHATFTADTINHNPIPERTLVWEILKANYDMSDVKWDYEGPFTYSGSPFKVELINLPEGVTADYSENEETNAGSYTGCATLSGDAQNYNPINDMTLIWEIKKADYDMSGVKWNYEEPFTYNGTAFKVELTNLPDGVSASYTENEETTAGSYTARATFSADTVNHNPISAMTLVWEIGKARIAKPAADGTEHVYDGTAQTYAVAGSAYYTAENAVRTDAGEQTVTVILTDKENCEWEDGTTDDLEYPFVIAKAENKWVTEYAREGWTEGDAPSEEAEPCAKYGEAKISYYTDEACTVEFTGSFEEAKAGVYYVRVTVSEGNNYRSLAGTYSFTVGEATSLLWLYITLGVLAVGGLAFLSVLLIKKKRD